MAAPHATNGNAEKHSPLARRGRYALPKGLCTKSSEWRLPPGKPAERLPPHYKLDCDFGTSLVIAWKNDGGEPIYVCEAHAMALGISLDGSVVANKPLREADRDTKNELPVMIAGPIPAPKKALPAASHSVPAHRVPVAAEQRESIDRQILACAAQLEEILSGAQCTIRAAETIDPALEQATLAIIENPAMTDTQKDETIQQLGALQESTKQAAGQDMTALHAFQIKQSVKERLGGKGNPSIAEEGEPYHRLLHDSLANAIHAAVPEAKDIEERLASLVKAKAELDTPSEIPALISA